MKQFALNLRNIPNHPGSWGKFIVCVYLSGWALATLFNAPATVQWTPIKIYVDAIGRVPFGTILLLSAIVPLLATATGRFWFRITTSAILMAVWGALFISSIAHSEDFRPATMACLAGVLGAFNSLVRLVDRWGEESAT